VLLSSGADINLGYKRGQSPLCIASMIGHCDVVKCLLSSGAFRILMLITSNWIIIET
jgi:ankyrin repeat protein